MAENTERIKVIYPPNV